jgi:tetratricopeptide (TPR) repeat protein
LKLAVKGRNPTREAEARVAQATTKLLGIHDFEGAMANIEQAISFYQKANETSALFNALNRKAEIQEGQGDLNGAIQTLGSAFSIPLQPDDRGLLFYGYLDRASVQEKKSWSHFNEKDFVKAHDVANGAKADYQRALAVAESRGWNGLADQTRSFMKDLETRRALLDTMAKSAERLKQASPTSDPAAPPTLPSERRPR